MKKTQLIRVFLGIGLLVFVILFIITEMENRAYKKYLSNELVGQIVKISHSPLYNLGILQDVLESGKITKAQAGELQLGFKDIAFETAAVRRMGNEIGRLQTHNNNVSVVNHDYYYFFLRLKMDMRSDEIKLTDDQMSIVKKMEQLMEEYYEVVKATLKYTGDIGVKGATSVFWNFYRDKGINDDYWIELLNGYERVTKMSAQIF